jgi:hypothetical protein
MDLRVGFISLPDGLVLEERKGIFRSELLGKYGLV